jgi:hypothetical protein
MRDVDIDVTRKQICQEAVVWSVRTRRDDGRVPNHGSAAARFADGAITSLHIGGDGDGRRAPDASRT